MTNSENAKLQEYSLTQQSMLIVTFPTGDKTLNSKEQCDSIKN